MKAFGLGMYFFCISSLLVLTLKFAGDCCCKGVELNGDVFLKMLSPVEAVSDLFCSFIMLLPYWVGATIAPSVVKPSLSIANAVSTLFLNVWAAIAPFSTLLLGGVIVWYSNVFFGLTYLSPPTLGNGLKIGCICLAPTSFDSNGLTFPCLSKFCL